MEDRDAEEFILLLRGYFRLLAEKELTVNRDSHSSFQAETGYLIKLEYFFLSNVYEIKLILNDILFSPLCNVFIAKL